MGTTTCARCRKPLRPRGHAHRSGRAKAARDLCNACYQFLRRRGQTSDFPRRNKPVADVVEDVALLRTRGLSVSEVADRIGMTVAALRQALHRARKSGSDGHGNGAGER